MSDRLMRVATSAVVAGWAIALSGPTFGQPSPPIKGDPWDTNRWHGSVTCTVTASSPSNRDYTNQETHKWEIVPAALTIWYIYMYYGYYWTVVGSGSDTDFTWTTNGQPGWGYMQFWVPEGRGTLHMTPQLNIARYYDPPTPCSPGDCPSGDSSGTTVRSKADGKLSTAAVSELMYFPTIVAPQDSKSVQGNSSKTINGSIFFKEPSDGINNVTCSWDFQYGPRPLPAMPGSLCLPSMPDCHKPFVLKPPLKRPDE
jgi:hypothetical protein